jgi:hypothetical protein
MFPLLAGRVEALDTWDDVRFLSVSVDRLCRWYRPACCASVMLRTRCRPPRVLT